MAQEVFIIPLTTTPQQFDITLSGVPFTIVSQWNRFIDIWEISLLDKNNNLPVIVALPLVTGINLLSQFEFLGIPGSLIVYTDGDELAVPTYENLGDSSNLYYVTDDDN